jgi:hypothetical protein
MAWSIGSIAAMTNQSPSMNYVTAEEKDVEKGFDLQAAVEQEQMVNVLMEWTVDGFIQYMSPACAFVFGYVNIVFFHHE